MPIKPIDLQTLFSQLDRVGRERAVEKEGAALQQSIQGAVIQKKAEETSRSVKRTEDAEDNTDQKVAIREDASSRQGNGGDANAEKREKEDAEGDEETDGGVIRDPRLGGKIDIIG